MRRIITIISAILATMNLQAQRATIAADVHSHIVTKEYMDYLRANRADMEDGYPLPDWSAEEHLRFMDDAGIAWSVLTMPSPQPYFGDAHEAAKIIRSVNEEQSHPQPYSCNMLIKKGFGVAFTAKYSLNPLFHAKASFTALAFSLIPFSS